MTILDYAKPTENERNLWWARTWKNVWIAIGGIVIPAICWINAFGPLVPKPDWQSGRLEDKVSLLLQGPVAAPLFLFFLYSMGCLGLVLFNERRFGHEPLVRLGVFSGVLHSILFLLVIGGSNVGPYAMFASGAVLIAWATIVVLARATEHRWQTAPSVLALLAVTAIGAFAIRRGWFAMLVIGVLGGGPMAALIAYICATWRLRDVGSSGRLWKWMIGFSGLYSAAWYIAIVQAMKAYAQLPKEPPPSCYIASAAARGHPRVVGSWECRCADGRVWRVNRQLQVLKGGEIALRAVAPRVHRHIRRVYDALGPRLAARMHHPLLADLAYAALKPCEWFAAAALRGIGAGDCAAKLYRKA